MSRYAEAGLAAVRKWLYLWPRPSCGCTVSFQRLEGSPIRSHPFEAWAGTNLVERRTARHDGAWLIADDDGHVSRGQAALFPWPEVEPPKLQCPAPAGI